MNSNNSIGKITSELIRLYPICIKKNTVIKKGIISNEKMGNSGNYMYMIMLTRSSERIFNPRRYTGDKIYIILRRKILSKEYSTQFFFL